MNKITFVSIVMASFLGIGYLALKIPANVTKKAVESIPPAVAPVAEPEKDTLEKSADNQSS